MARLRGAATAAAILGCAAIPAALLHQALAATAGTLFEAAPFVLAVTFFRGPVARRVAALTGCGCGSAAGPAALSLTAAALCWETFGPAVALARFGAAVLLHALRPPRTGQAEPVLDPLEQLETIALPAFALALIAAFAQSGGPLVGLAGLPPALLRCLEGLAGLAAGAIAPCATAAVALAGMLRGPAPLAAAGLLATAGLVPPLRAAGQRTAERYDARFGLTLLGIACAVLAARAGSGFVHPRLVPLLWLAVPAAALAVRARPATRVRRGAVVPAAMLAALVLGSAPPAGTTTASPLDGLFAGERIAFSGVATFVRGRTTLERYAISCCRADASAIALPTDLRLHLAPGSWIAVRGTIARDRDGFFVRAAAWRRVEVPADPYLYR
jgi:hypothetical protein